MMTGSIAKQAIFAAVAAFSGLQLPSVLGSQSIGCLPYTSSGETPALQSLTSGAACSGEVSQPISGADSVHPGLGAFTLSGREVLHAATANPPGVACPSNGCGASGKSTSGAVCVAISHSTLVGTGSNPYRTNEAEVLVAVWDLGKPGMTAAACQAVCAGYTGLTC